MLQRAWRSSEKSVVRNKSQASRALRKSAWGWESGLPKPASVLGRPSEEKGGRPPASFKGSLCHQSQQPSSCLPLIKHLIGTCALSLSNGLTQRRENINTDLDMISVELKPLRYLLTTKPRQGGHALSPKGESEG